MCARSPCRVGSGRESAPARKGGRNTGRHAKRQGSTRWAAGPLRMCVPTEDVTAVCHERVIRDVFTHDAPRRRPLPEQSL